MMRLALLFIMLGAAYYTYATYPDAKSFHHDGTAKSMPIFSYVSKLDQAIKERSIIWQLYFKGRIWLLSRDSKDKQKLESALTVSQIEGYREVESFLRSLGIDNNKDNRQYSNTSKSNGSSDRSKPTIILAFQDDNGNYFLQLKNAPSSKFMFDPEYYDSMDPNAKDWAPFLIASNSFWFSKGKLQQLHRDTGTVAARGEIQTLLLNFPDGSARYNGRLLNISCKSKSYSLRKLRTEQLSVIQKKVDTLQDNPRFLPRTRRPKWLFSIIGTDKYVYVDDMIYYGGAAFSSNLFFGEKGKMRELKIDHISYASDGGSVSIETSEGTLYRPSNLKISRFDQGEKIVEEIKNRLNQKTPQWTTRNKAHPLVENALNDEVIRELGIDMSRYNGPRVRTVCDLLEAST